MAKLKKKKIRRKYLKEQVTLKELKEAHKKFIKGDKKEK